MENPFKTFADWNNAYTKLLRKRNKAQTRYDSAFRGFGSDKERQLATAALERANAAIEAHKAFHVESAVMFNTSRSR